MLQGRKILLGITGSIAAYKAAFLIRLLVKEGAEVQPILTESAAEFITPLTLATLAKRPALTKFHNREEGTWNNHVKLGLWADAMVIAPATANTLSKMAAGQSDSLLLAAYLSARCPVFIAPAMDLDMYAHASTSANLQTLKDRGNMLIAGALGELASGLDGAGRMAEPAEIVAYLTKFFSEDLPLSGKKVLITAGPTYEAIDSVRFIGNHSSGKMGYRLAEEAARRGAEVVLVAGPTNEQLEVTGIRVVKVTSAAEMLEACRTHYRGAAITIMAAAVADFTPTTRHNKKIKKEDLPQFDLQLKPTTDILKELGTSKSKGQILVGFALETNNEVANATKKLEAKNLDLIVLNSLNDKGAGFSHDTNKIAVIGRDNIIVNFELKSKAGVAVDILNAIQALEV